jgi:hypothetical protein
MSHVFLVAGPSGVGKTHWIAEQLQQHPPNQPIAYLNLGGGSFPLDGRYLQTLHPKLDCLSDENASVKLVEHQGAANPIYIEVGFHIALDSLVLPLVDCRNIVLVPPKSPETDWHHWTESDEVIVGVGTAPESITNLQMQRALLSGEVFDPPSLDIFWQELIQGAYGSVQRAKAILNIADGQTFLFNFISGLEGSDYRALEVPLCLDGRPQEFSGLEVVGEGLDGAGITETLQDCFVADEMLAQYQAYLKTAQETVANAN